MASISTFARSGLVLSTVLLGLAACNKVATNEDQLSWARAALERNDQLEVIAVDPQAQVLTVRDKVSGQTIAVRANEVVAMIPGTSDRKASITREPASAPSQAPAPAPAIAEPAPQPSEVQPAPAAAPAQTPAGEAVGEPMVAQSGQPAEPAQQTPDSSAVASSSPGMDIPAVPGEGKIVASGPGYAIRRVSASAAGMPASVAREPKVQSVSTAPVEYRSEALVCQGARLLQINNRNLVFDGDAITAEDGCEIHITNSRIVAKGVGVTAHAANVHIRNSQIEGDSASVQASGGAQVYLHSSTFKGLPRRMDTATVHDMGGNVWN